jgi:hypothetical protein
MHLSCVLQGSAQLPAMDSGADAIQSAFKLACGYCDLFWHGVFARLPAAKAAKSDGAADFKAVMEALLAGEALRAAEGMLLWLSNL